MSSIKRTSASGKIYTYYPGYHREWRALRRWIGRMQAIELLGGRCANCGYNVNLDGLEFDHVIPTRKSSRVSLVSSIFWKTPLDKIGELVSDCQLLCGTCHRIKTRREARETGGWRAS